MKTLIPARACARMGVCLLLGLFLLAPGVTIGLSPPAPAPTPAQQTLIELHQNVGAGWWSLMPVNSSTAPPLPARWRAPVPGKPLKRVTA